MDLTPQIVPAVRVPIGDFVPNRALTPAERRLLPFLAEAWEYKAIAAACALSERTVRETVERIAHTLPGCGKTQLKAMRYAVMWWAEGELSRRARGAAA